MNKPLPSDTPESAPAPNITPRHQPGKPSTGERCMGWLLLVWPVAGAVAVTSTSATIMPQLNCWDYLIWLAPLAFSVAVALLSTVFPGYPAAWGLCALGDIAERRGVPRYIVWPVVVLLLAGLGTWLLGSVSGSWQVVEPEIVPTCFIILTIGALWGLLYLGRALVPSVPVLRGIYVATLVVNVGFALTALMNWHSGALKSDYLFVQKNSGWARMYNPLLPQGGNSMSTYTTPAQDSAANLALLQAMLECPPPEGTQIRGRIGYANTEMLLFTSIAPETLERWLAEQFSTCTWQKMPAHLAFHIMGHEYLPSSCTDCRYTRLPNAGGAQRYLIHNDNTGEFIFLRIPGPFADTLLSK